MAGTEISSRSSHFQNVYTEFLVYARIKKKSSKGGPSREHERIYQK